MQSGSSAFVLAVVFSRPMLPPTPSEIIRHSQSFLLGLPTSVRSRNLCRLRGGMQKQEQGK